jgi:two-component system phosphate regulon response regulator PhoB
MAALQVEADIITAEVGIGGTDLSVWSDSLAGAGSPDVVARRVLIVERDAALARALRSRLADAGFSVTIESGVQAFDAVERDTPDLLVLDWNLPGARAPQLLRQMVGIEPRRRPRLLAVSEACSEQQVLSGFEMGVDDFVFKPYSVAEVVARVQAILRSTPSSDSDVEVLSFYALRVDPLAGTVIAREQPVQLRRQEFRLLHFLMQRAERAFSRTQLLARIWGEHSMADARAVDVTVQRTRKALTPHGCAEYLQTVRGVGYRLSARNED